jgi:hyaluronoglucosaminidase
VAARLGLIEGYYGEPWSEVARAKAIDALAPRGYGFFIHAPKADDFLRRKWREPYPDVNEARLRRLAAHCKSRGVRFGVGLSPYEIYRAFDADAKASLAERLALFDSIGVEILAILFDDMRGDLPDLAATQAGILHWVAERSQASEIIFCPSYYTDDPILDRIFGERPANYLEDLGRMLDPSIAVFWTGERVCSRDYSVAHLERVTDRLRRKPFLWDNYPVNDGPRMSQHLHLRAFTGRPAAITDHISGHAINPALQPTLTLIPALTLADSYARGERYDDGEAFAHAASEVLGNELAGVVKEDLNMLQDVALDELGDRLPSLRERYARFDHPGAKEIMAWLDGKYRFTGEMM